MAKRTDVWSQKNNLSCRVGRPIVHQDNFVIRVIEPLKGIQARRQRAFGVVTAYHDRNLGIAGELVIRGSSEFPLDRGK